MDTQWTQEEFEKLLQVSDSKQDMQVYEKVLNRKKNKDENYNIFEHLNCSYAYFLDRISEFCHNNEGIMSQIVIEGIALYSDFTKEGFVEKLNFHYFFKTTLKDFDNYMNIMSSGQAVDYLQNEDQDHLENTTHYLLAQYFHQLKANKNDFIQNDTEKGKILNQIVDSYFHQNYASLLTFAKELNQMKTQQPELPFQKKIDKLIGQTSKKIRTLMNQSTRSTDEKERDLKALQKKAFQRIHSYIHESDYQDYPQILTLQNDINKAFQTLEEDAQCERNTRENNVQEEQIINEEELKIIESFYAQHHLYYKKSKIIEEILNNPLIIQFYQTYQDIQKCTNHQEVNQKSEELIVKIQESGLKGTETLRRLLRVLQKRKESEIKSIENDIQKDLIQPVDKQEKETITIDNHHVIKESLQEYPRDLQKIICLLAKEDREQVEWLKSLIFQIGYDKVHGYLLKYPYIRICDLQVIMKLDRSLRFEYQCILEDIEMYFRSTFTYFLSNKYDQKCFIDNTHQSFYKRGYLMRKLFHRSKEHMEKIRRLHERIDDEIKNNNIQVKEEYNRYQYNISFSTAAGIMTFGWIINIFENLNYQDQEEYLKKYFYHLTPQTFKSWMLSIGDLRNRCAHYQSLYRLSYLKELRPIMTRNVDRNAFDDDFKHSSLFYYTLIMTRLSPNISHIEDFIDGVGALLRKVERECGVFDLQKDYSFPKNWRTILENEKSKRINFHH